MNAPLTPRALRLLHRALLVAVLSVASGCGLWTSIFGDPEGASGPDAYRHQAIATPLDEAVTDDVSISDGDQTDWRVLQIYDAGRLSIEMSVDEKDAELSLTVYDRYGSEMERFMVPGGEVSTLAVDVTRGGRYFLKVRAESGPASAYDLTATLGAPSRTGTSHVPACRPVF